MYALICINWEVPNSLIVITKFTFKITNSAYIDYALSLIFNFLSFIIYYVQIALKIFIKVIYITFWTYRENEIIIEHRV